jgi:cytochrome P450
MVFMPLPFMTRMAERYGDITYFRLFGRRAYLLNHPDLIARVLIHEADAFEKLPRQTKVIQQIFGEGILVTGGNRWKTDRQHLQAAFGKSMLDRSQRVTLHCTQRMLGRWRSVDEVSLGGEMTRLSAEIASLLLIGEDDPELAKQLADAVVFMSDEFAREMNAMVRLPDWLPLSHKRRKLQSMAVFNKLFADVIEKRRPSSRNHDDFLQYLIDRPQPRDSNPQFVRDQLLTILVAAYHATSMALVWIFYLLDQYPLVEERLIAALAATRRVGPAQPIFKCEYLEQVVSEALRLYPPAWALFARRSKREVRLAGYQIAAGGWFYISPFVTQRSEAFFPNARQFDPDRFSAQRRAGIPPHAWFPFGMGGHACIGSRLAMEQLQLITAAVVETFLLRRPADARPVALSALLALRPKHDLVMRLQASPLRTDSPNRPGQNQLQLQST